MIIFKKDQNIFDSTARYIVNPVNSKGVSGKGLALEFKIKFPNNFKLYREFCSSSSPKGGDLLFYYPLELDRLKGNREVINFCTKEEWRKPSKIEWIEKGMIQLVDKINELYPDNQYPVPLLALPMLGCGEGGLEEKEVLRVITQSLVECKFDVEIYTSKLPTNSEPIKEVSESK